eukprot:scaffold246556_cov32-Tisochrysis_lutea.AAC.1
MPPFIPFCFRFSGSGLGALPKAGFGVWGSSRPFALIFVLRARLGTCDARKFRRGHGYRYWMASLFAVSVAQWLIRLSLFAPWAPQQRVLSSAWLVASSTSSVL